MEKIRYVSENDFNIKALSKTHAGNITRPHWRNNSNTTSKSSSKRQTVKSLTHEVKSKGNKE